jgi:hypothetical protein
MLDEARRWAETQFGTADLGDARRTHRLVSTMAAIARAPDESLPRQLGSLANTKAGYRLFDCGAVTRTAIMDPHVAQCRTEAARHPIVLMVHDDTILDFSRHRTLKGAGRVGDDRGTGFLAHSCLAVLPSGATLGLAHQTIGARPPKGVTPQTRASAVWAEPSRRSAALPTVRPLSRSRTGAPTSSRILRACGRPAGTRLCGPLGSVAWSRAAVRSPRCGPPAPWAPRASGPRLARRWSVWPGARLSFCRPATVQGGARRSGSGVCGSGTTGSRGCC